MHFLPTQHQDHWIKAKVESGDYANASEVLREAIREKMERERKREAKLQDLRAVVAEGDKGPFIPLDIEQIIREAEEEFGNQQDGEQK
jgi:antitoxin ParD1/3/4